VISIFENFHAKVKPGTSLLYNPTARIVYRCHNKLYLRRTWYTLIPNIRNFITDDVQTEQQRRKNSWSQFLFWFIQQQQLDPFSLCFQPPSSFSKSTNLWDLISIRSIAQANRCFATDQLINCDQQSENKNNNKHNFSK
jgi:hypothetical protein